MQRELEDLCPSCYWGRRAVLIEAYNLAEDRGEAMRHEAKTEGLRTVGQLQEAKRREREDQDP